ncbi:MAG: sigma-70 family RNA polymerase sigma factor [Clostridiales bacterium]|nr:sigma-70 family RNA polymerase sigma factor [Clostridiales bacterium]
MNKELLTQAFERLHDRLLSRARAILPSDEDARDVLQEAFYRLWKATPELTEQSHAEGMMVRTVNNLAIDSYRSSQRHVEVELNSNITDLPDDDNDERQALFNNVNAIIARNLTKRDREILLKRDSMGWDFEDIAYEYGLTPANVRVIISRARHTVREIYMKTKKQDLS